MLEFIIIFWIVSLLAGGASSTARRPSYSWDWDDYRYFFRNLFRSRKVVRQEQKEMRKKGYRLGLLQRWDLHEGEYEEILQENRDEWQRQMDELKAGLREISDNLDRISRKSLLIDSLGKSVEFSTSFSKEQIAGMSIEDKVKLYNQTVMSRN